MYTQICMRQSIFLFSKFFSFIKGVPLKVAHVLSKELKYYKRCIFLHHCLSALIRDQKIVSPGEGLATVKWNLKLYQFAQQIQFGRSSTKVSHIPEYTFLICLLTGGWNEWFYYAVNCNYSICYIFRSISTYPQL